MDDGRLTRRDLLRRWAALGAGLAVPGYGRVCSRKLGPGCHQNRYRRRSLRSSGCRC